jgi:hypothetical protein
VFRTKRETVQKRSIIVFEIGYKSHLKNWNLVQDQGGADVQPAGILKYSEELKRGPNTEIGQKDFFEMASKYCC